MNVIGDLLVPEGVIADLKAANKRQVLHEMAEVAARLCAGDERAILDALLERERLGSTGIGRGIAIPHGKIPGLKRVLGVFARLDPPVDFDTVDDEPVDLVFLMLAPEADGAEHLKTLARISRLFRDDEFCRKLRGSRGADALYAAITAPKARAA